MALSRRQFLTRTGQSAATLLALERLALLPSNLHAATLETGATRMLRSSMAPETPSQHALDAERIRSIAAWTALTLETPNPVPFGADILHTATGERLMRAYNAVGPEHDPSSHAEVRTIRLATKKLEAFSLRGYTLYTTCEPCPMCMACALWAGLDRVVYGATIADANRFCNQILISATEVVSRSDIKCEVTGPVEQAACVALFTHPNMQKAFKMWSSKRGA